MRNTIIGGIALIVAAAPALALDGPGRALIASNTVQLAVLPVQSGEPGLLISKGFIPPYSGTVRLIWEIRSEDGSPVNTEALVSHMSQCPTMSTSSMTFVVQTESKVLPGLVPSNFTSCNAQIGWVVQYAMKTQ